MDDLPANLKDGQLGLKGGEASKIRLLIDDRISSLTRLKAIEHDFSILFPKPWAYKGLTGKATTEKGEITDEKEFNLRINVGDCSIIQFLDWTHGAQCFAGSYSGKLCTTRAGSEI
jgi:hypothetical protein